MDLEASVKGMMNARAAFRTKKGISNPDYISEQMQRLAQYTGAVEEHLAQLEEDIEITMTNKFIKYTNQEDKKSVNQAETLTRFETGVTKGQIAKLKRYVNSSWQIVGVSQSRWNHLSKGIVGQT